MNRFATIVRAALLPVAIVCCSAGFAQTAQSRYYATNVKRVDSFNTFLKTYCDSIKPLPVDEKQIRRDRRNIMVMNQLFNSTTSFQEFATLAKKNDLVQSNYGKAGLVNFHEYKFYPLNGYVNITAQLTVIDDNIVYRKFILTNSAKRKCAADNELVTFFDYTYLGKHLLPVIDFPVSGCGNCDSLIIEALDRPSLNAMAGKHTAYQFTPGGTTDVVQSLLFADTYLQPHTYNNKVAPGILVQLIQLKEYDTIRDLLNSPNHLMAVNAYEALIYLRGKGELALSAQTESKMKALVSSDTEIPVFCGRDCKPTNFAYNTLKVKEQDINDKYQAALEQ